MNFLLKKTGLSPRTLVGPLSRERELLTVSRLLVQTPLEKPTGAGANLISKN